MHVIVVKVERMVTYSQLLKIGLDNPSQYLQILFTLVVALASIEQMGWLIVVGAILNIIAPIIEVIWEAISNFR